jgi:hypothetical protein
VAQHCPQSTLISFFARQFLSVDAQVFSEKPGAGYKKSIREHREDVERIELIE